MMKRILIVLLFLCPIFRAVGQVYKKDIGSSYKAPVIGKSVPDVLVSGVQGLRLDGKRAADDGTVRLSAFRGKLLILDFWATWCAPCRSMVPVMDSLQKVFGNKIVFLPVTYQSAAEVKPVLAAMQKARPFRLPGVTSDKVLHRLFPHTALPHYVWIDKFGVLRAITEEAEVTGANIRKMLDGSGAEGDLAVTPLSVKRDSVAAYDPGRALLIDGNGGNGSRLQYLSLLSGYKAGLSPGIAISAFDTVRGQRFTARNVPFPWLCRLAFGEKGRSFPASRTLLLSRDSTRMNSTLSGQAFEAWLDAGNGWCYELALPPRLATGAYTFMQADLRRLFPQYQVSVEQKQMRCLALVRVGDIDRLHAAGGDVDVSIGPYQARLHNAHLSQLMMRLERQYLQNSPLPLVDATGYSGRVDLTLDAPLYDVTALNKALSPYGLALREQQAPVDVLVVRDAVR